MGCRRHRPLPRHGDDLGSKDGKENGVIDLARMDVHQNRGRPFGGSSQLFIASA